MATVNRSPYMDVSNSTIIANYSPNNVLLFTVPSNGYSYISVSLENSLPAFNANFSLFFNNIAYFQGAVSVPSPGPLGNSVTPVPGLQNVLVPPGTQVRVTDTDISITVHTFVVTFLNQ